MPYGITQCYLPPDRGDNHAFTPSRSRYSISRPRRGARISWPMRVLSTYWCCPGVTVACRLSSSLERGVLYARQGPRAVHRTHSLAVRIGHGSVVPPPVLLGHAAGRARQRGRRGAAGHDARRPGVAAEQREQRQCRWVVVGRHARLPGVDDRRPGRRQDGAHAAVHDVRVHGRAEHQLRSVNSFTSNGVNHARPVTNTGLTQ